MNAGDRWLQRRRIAKATPWVRDGDRLLDVGCFDRTLLRAVEPRVRSATGVDPGAEPFAEGKLRVLRGRLPGEPSFEAGSFDCITLLAVLEHVPDPAALAREFHRILAPGGRVILTVPDAFVDRILEVLMRLRIVDGMDVDDHHGFEVAQTAPLFEQAGFRLAAHRAFQLGLNHLFVFEKPGERGTA